MFRTRSTNLGLLAVAAAGCTGQNVEGAWRGGFPLEGANVCEVKLRSDHSATVQCDDTAIVGGGNYRYDGQNLEIDLAILTYHGKKVESPKPYRFRVEGHGNVIRLRTEDRAYDWSRTIR